MALQFNPNETKLDKSRPYGVIVGDPRIQFEQDGVHFGPDEKPVERWTTLDMLANERRIRETQIAKERRLAIQRAARERDRLIKEID
jgi:hypothetical protein